MMESVNPSQHEEGVIADSSNVIYLVNGEDIKPNFSDLSCQVVLHDCLAKGVKLVELFSHNTFCNEVKKETSEYELTIKQEDFDYENGSKPKSEMSQTLKEKVNDEDLMKIGTCSSPISIEFGDANSNEAATYEEMRLKLKEAENITTEYNSSDSDTCSTSHTIQASTSLKKNLRSNRAISLSEEDEELAFPPPPEKKLCLSSSGKPKSTIGEPSGSCSNCRKEIKLLLTEVLKVCCQIRMSNDLIHKEVLTIGQDIKILKAMNKSTSNKGEKEIIFPDFPFQSTDDLDDFDLTLKNEEDTKNALIKYLKNLGGVSYKGALQVMLRKLISPQIGVLYSLKGRTGRKLKFDSLELFKCIKSSIMENSNYAGITVTEIERVVGIWLIHSKYKKREKKI